MFAIKMFYFSIIFAVAAFSHVSCHNITNNVDKLPTVVISFLVRNKAHTLPYFLSLLTKLDYPKDRISLWIRSDHNEDKSVEILKTWLEEVSILYHSIDVQMAEDGPESMPDQSSSFHWSTSRFEHVIALREQALDFARKTWADFIFMIDADVFLTETSTLMDLVEKNMDVVSPMLISDGLYSNFWCGMTEHYYYQRTEEYKPILYMEEVGCFNVPMVHTAVLINLKRVTSHFLTYDSNKIKNYDGPLNDDVIAFAVSANFSGIPLHICNEKKYGYITVPLDKIDSISVDLQQLTNVKVDSIYEGNMIAAEPYFDQFIVRLKKDKLGFDEVYMINLERRPDRRELMEAVFSELGIDANIVPAVDGRKLDEAALAEWGVNIMPGYEDPYHKRPMTLGEIGCFLSHYSIWKNQSFKRIVVFEDDIRFEHNFRRKLENINYEIQNENIAWDLVYLGRKPLDDDEKPRVSHSLVHAGYSYWTLGYLLSGDGARKLLDAHPLNNLLPVDEYLPIMFNEHPSEEWKSFYPETDLVALSADPLLLYPIRYTGEPGYISDTENSTQAPTLATNREEL